MDLGGCLFGPSLAVCRVLSMCSSFLLCICILERGWRACLFHTLWFCDFAMDHEETKFGSAREEYEVVHG